MCYHSHRPQPAPAVVAGNYAFIKTTSTEGYHRGRLNAYNLSDLYSMPPESDILPIVEGDSYFMMDPSVEDYVLTRDIDADGDRLVAAAKNWSSNWYLWFFQKNATGDMERTSTLTKQDGGITFPCGPDDVTWTWWPQICVINGDIIYTIDLIEWKFYIIDASDWNAPVFHKNFTMSNYDGEPISGIQNNEPIPEMVPRFFQIDDMENDPWEMKNIYDDPEYQEIIQDLKDEMHKLQKEAGDEPYHIEVE
ncbi:MAG: DUF4976 domain-containing protein [Candidatus Lokiarchaeota archaeon]|nr:DUF4976 domain-containing protein [Candidatus Lokiarchaeota archaeon]